MTCFLLIRVLLDFFKFQDENIIIQTFKDGRLNKSFKKDAYLISS